MTTEEIASRLQPITDELSALLANEAPRRAELVRDLYRTVKNDTHAIERAYCNLDWWGGSGSMADFCPERPNSQNRYTELLFALYEVFEAAGYSCPMAKSWTEIFSRWIKDGKLD